jgi:hypothetical protein
MSRFYDARGFARESSLDAGHPRGAYLSDRGRRPNDRANNGNQPSEDPSLAVAVPRPGAGTDSQSSAWPQAQGDRPGTGAGTLVPLSPASWGGGGWQMTRGGRGTALRPEAAGWSRNAAGVGNSTGAGFFSGVGWICPGKLPHSRCGCGPNDRSIHDECNDREHTTTGRRKLPGPGRLPHDERASERVTEGCSARKTVGRTAGAEPCSPPDRCRNRLSWRRTPARAIPPPARDGKLA